MARARPTSRLAALALLAPLAGGACAEPPERWNVLLVSIDTLRADRTSFHGDGRDTTPNLARYAARGVVFERALSPRAKTTPAMASVLTGLYPHDHGVRDLARPLEPGVPTVAERLRAAGYSTGAAIGNFVLQRELAGLDRGFRTWIEDLPDLVGVPPDDVPQRRATSLTDGGLALVDELAAEGRPWFCWLHYMDPHGLYDAPDEYRVDSGRGPDLVPDPAVPSRHPPVVADYNVLPEERQGGRVDANAVRDRYDAEVRYVDAEVGRLLDALAASGRLERTWVVVLADHGESLGEHAYWFEHGRYAYQATCHVPLVVVPPRARVDAPPPGRREADVSLVDVAPTLLELAGLRSPRLAPGTGARSRSLVELLWRDDRTPRPVFCEKVERADVARAVQTKAVRVGRWKLYRRSAHDGERAIDVGEELYDVVADPAETTDRLDDAPADAPLAELRAALLEFTAADRDLPDMARMLQEHRDTLARERPDVLEKLEALGY